MRPTSLILVGPLLALAILVAPGVAQMRQAQPAAPPAIHRVTLQRDGVVTITGIGLGPGLVVTVDGQAVQQLPGATDTRVQVLAPATVVTMPGSYRLTVADPLRRVGDAFVVVSGPRGDLPAGQHAAVDIDGRPIASVQLVDALPSHDALQQQIRTQQATIAALQQRLREGQQPRDQQAGRANGVARQARLVIMEESAGAAGSVSGFRTSPPGAPVNPRRTPSIAIESPRNH